MKHKLQTLLKHKLQWLLLLVALLGVSQGVWATYTINANTTFYIDATNFQGNYSNGVYIAIVTNSTNGGKIGNIRYGNTGGVSGYVPKNDKWDYKSFTSKSGNIYTFKVTSQITGVYGILVSSKDLSGYNDLWEVNVSGTTESSISGKIYTLSSDYTTHGERRTCCSSGTWSDYCTTVGGTAKVNGSTTTNISRGASVTLSLTGQTSGSTVVWQKSTDGGSSWSNVGSITDIPTQNTQYRAKVTNGCDAYSSVATVKLPTTIYVDVKSAASWTAAYLYYRGGAGDNGWPGTAMTAVPGNDGWYSGEIPADRTNYIINQNKDGDVNQTNDLTTDGKQKCIKVKSSSGKHDVEETTCPTICTTPTKSQYTMASGQSATYDGNAHKPTITKASGAGNISKYYYSSDNGSTWTAGKPTNAGVYKIKVDVAEGTSYCAANGIVITNTFTINQIDQPHAVTIDNETTSYCVSTLGTDISLEASGGDGTGSYSFAITGGTVASDKRSISGSTLTVSAAGTVIITATRAADNNYNARVSTPKEFTFTANGPKVFTLTNEGATALCGKGDGSSTGTGGSLRLTGSETGYSYQLKKDDANYGDPVEGTGSALTFPVTSSGVYTCTAYYGDPSQCPTEMNVEDGGIVLVVNITPRLLPGTPTVRQYQAVTITSTNTEIDKWVLSGEGADAYTYDSTPNSITLKANTAGSPYRLIATTSAGCTATAVITVIADTENCVAP